MRTDESILNIDDEEKEEIENDSEYLYLKGKIYKKEGNFDEAKLCFKKSSDLCNVDAMYEYAKTVFIEDPEKAFPLFDELSQKKSHSKSKNLLSAYNILKNINHFTKLHKEAQLFIMKNFGKYNFSNDFFTKKKLIIDQKALKKFNNKNFFEYEDNSHHTKKSKNNPLLTILSEFDEVYVELNFDSKIFKESFDSQKRIKDDQLKSYILKIRKDEAFEKIHDKSNSLLFYYLQKIKDYMVVDDFSSLKYTSICDFIPVINNDLMMLKPSFTVVVNMPDTKKIENKFGENTIITKVYIKEGTFSIGNSTFSGCKELKSIVIPASFEYIGPFAFKDCISLTQIPLISITEVSRSTFSGCLSLACISLPLKVERIGDFAFYNCQSLQTITIPKNTVSIGDNAFAECVNLFSIAFNANLNTIGHYAFSGCQITTLVIPSNVTSIGDYSFRNCEKLESVTFSPKMTRIANGAFKKCFNLKILKNHEFIKIIESKAFSHCSSLEAINFPQVEFIGNSAFNKCKSLGLIDIPNCSSIGNYAFKECVSIISIKIPEKVTVLSEGLFCYCKNLTNIDIPKSVLSIQGCCFLYCVSLKEIIFPPNLKYLGDSALAVCILLTKISLPKTIQTIGSYCFGNCISLEEISTPKRGVSIEKGAFSMCLKLKSFELPDKIPTISSLMFFGCKELKEIKVPKSVESIDYGAFEDCTSFINANH